MKSKTTYKRTVQPAEVDFSLRATIVSMIGYVLDIAGIDADEKGFGLKKLHDDNRSWVLSRMALDFYRLPEKYEKIDVTTWVNNYGRLITTRNFTINDENNHRIFAAVTQWAMIDLSTRQPLDLCYVSEYDNHICADSSPIEHPRKVAQANPTKTKTHEVAYSDIDFNRHVNTLRYFSLMLDMLPIEMLSNTNAAHVEINFLHESQYGDTLTIGYEQRDTKSIFEIKNNNNIAICRAAIEFRKM
ncbi:MAG: acyl-ACP thioesterase [Prevotellaceae bacterium]|jgi:acyl-ACP thioesterase|nr:acyl-ACP thioesterase [Prevotellaceae bacterium]